jgi:hypothetical protein
MTAAVLMFDATFHEYRLPDGRQVPSVTQILSAVGVSTDFEALMAMSDERARQIEAKRFLGTAVHADCHAFDDDDLVWGTVDPKVVPYLDAWRVFRENTGLQPMTRERRVFHAAHFYCGTLDGIFIDPRGRHVLVDIKTGDPADSGCQFQTAAYEAAFQAEHPDFPIDERWAVQLVPERKGVPYRVTPYTDWRDFGAFTAFVTTYNAQAARRRATR